jgi:hypothetical protein
VEVSQELSKHLCEVFASSAYTRALRIRKTSRQRRSSPISQKIIRRVGHARQVILSRGYSWNLASRRYSVSLPFSFDLPSVLIRAPDRVTIGKYKEDHPCNPQTLRILAGDDPSHLEDVLDINLKNDSTPETGAVRHSARVWTGDMSTVNLWDLGRESNVIVSFLARYDLKCQLMTSGFITAFCSEIRQVGSPAEA